MRDTPPDIARSLMLAARAHTAAVMARLVTRGYPNFPFASASLLWLMDEGGSRSTVLAQRAGVTKQAMSQLVKQMEQQGYLEQVSDVTDTRAKLVKMTPRGISVKAACMQIREELNRELTAALKVGGATKMQENLDRAAALLTSLSGLGRR